MIKPKYIRWKDRPFFIRLFHWEYWPFEVVYFPVFFYYLWLSIRARTCWFFNAANPGIETGGMLGESKTPILEMVPDEYKPKTISVHSGLTSTEIYQRIQDANMQYPLLCKPDRGERGLMVERIEDAAALNSYIHSTRVPFLIQEFVDFTVELGVLYYRLPTEKKGKVVSVVMKEFLSVTGDGKSTLCELIFRRQRAILQWKKLYEKFSSIWNDIIPAGKYILLEPIGNHARGTKFINGNQLIDDRLHQVFDHITDQLSGVYYCRYDLKCNSIEELKEGKSIRIVEVNGVGSEPAHIYDPAYSIFSAWKDIIHLWGIIYQIAKENHKKGIAYMTTSEIIDQWKLVKAYRKTTTHE